MLGTRKVSCCRENRFFSHIARILILDSPHHDVRDDAKQDLDIDINIMNTNITPHQRQHTKHTQSHMAIEKAPLVTVEEALYCVRTLQLFIEQQDDNNDGALRLLRELASEAWTVLLSRMGKGVGGEVCYFFYGSYYFSFSRFGGWPRVTIRSWLQFPMPYRASKCLMVV